jgi:hypothetical protein
MKSRRLNTVSGMLLLLFSLVVVLASCGGGDGGARVPPPTTALIVGVPTNDAVARGGFNAYSASVIPGELYKISVTGLTDDIDLNVYDTDNTFTNPLLCPIDNSSTVGIGNEDCIISPSGNTLFFGVDGRFVARSAALYTIDIELLPLTANVSLSLPVGDITTRQSAGVYSVPVPAGTTQTVSVTGLSDDVDLYVFIDDGAVIAPATCFPDNTLLIGKAPEDCTVTVSSGTLFFVVDGIFSSAFPAQYTVLVTPTPGVPVPVNEGTVTPVGVLSGSPITGQVGFNGTSFYAASGLIAGTRYTISITGLSADADLAVFGGDNTFTAKSSCLIDNTSFLGGFPESCTLPAPPGGALFFTVSATLTSTTDAAYTILVGPGP